MTGDSARLAISALGGVKRVRPGDDLCALSLEALTDNGETLQNGDILVLAQKIVSKSESRYADLGVDQDACLTEILENSTIDEIGYNQRRKKTHNKQARFNGTIGFEVEFLTHAHYIILYTYTSNVCLHTGRDVFGRCENSVSDSLQCTSTDHASYKRAATVCLRVCTHTHTHT